MNEESQVVSADSRSMVVSERKHAPKIARFINLATPFLLIMASIAFVYSLDVIMK